MQITDTYNLVKLLESVCLNGAIQSCVLHLDGATARIIAADMTSSLTVEGVVPFQHPDKEKLGIADMGLLIKYLKPRVQDQVAISRVENRLNLKPEHGSTLKFLLTEAELIPTYDSDWETDPSTIKDEIAAYPGSLQLLDESVSEFLSLYSTFAPKNVRIDVSKRGIVTVHAGNNNTHSFSVTLGKCPEFTECSIDVYGTHLVAILKALDFADSPKLSVHSDPDMPTIIHSDTVGWVLRPSTENA